MFINKIKQYNSTVVLLLIMGISLICIFGFNYRPNRLDYQERLIREGIKNTGIIIDIDENDILSEGFKLKYPYHLTVKHRVNSKGYIGKIDIYLADKIKYENANSKAVNILYDKDNPSIMILESHETDSNPVEIITTETTKTHSAVIDRPNLKKPFGASESISTEPTTSILEETKVNKLNEPTFAAIESFSQIQMEDDSIGYKITVTYTIDDIRYSTAFESPIEEEYRHQLQAGILLPILYNPEDPNEITISPNAFDPENNRHFKLTKNGIKSEGTIISVFKTNKKINENFVVYLTIKHAVGTREYMSGTTEVVSPNKLKYMQVDSTIPIIYDPDSPARIIWMPKGR